MVKRLTSASISAKTLDWDLLRVFYIVAQAGSLTSAARTLGVSQSSVSRQIAALERSLKVYLFHRNPQGLTVTESGESFFKMASEVFERMTVGLAYINEYRHEPIGPLRITTSVAFGSAWLTPRMSKFRTLYPEITVSLLLTDNLELDLSLRQADIAIRFFAQTRLDFIQQHLMGIRFHAFASKDYLSRRGVPQRPEDLDRHDIIVYGDELPAPVADLNWLLAAGTKIGTKREPILRVSSVYAIFQAVRNGFGIGALPFYLSVEDASLVEVLPSLEGPRTNAYLVYPEDLRYSRRVSVLRDFILEEAKGALASSVKP